MQIQKFILILIKTKKENYNSNPITVIVLENNSYPYVCITTVPPTTFLWEANSPRN